MAGPFEPKGVRSLRRIAFAVRSRLEPGEAVRWAVHARTARGVGNAPVGSAEGAGLPVLVVATDRTIHVFTVSLGPWPRVRETLARFSLRTTPVGLEPGRLLLGRGEFVLLSLAAQSDARVLLDYMGAVQRGAPVEADARKRRTSVPPMPGAFRLPQPVRSRSFRSALIPAVVSLLVVGAAVLASSVGSGHGPATAGAGRDQASGSAVCQAVTAMDETAARLPAGDPDSYAARLGQVLPPTSPSGGVPDQEGAIGLAAYASSKYDGGQWAAEARRDGFRQAYQRRWSDSWVEVVEFDSHAHALAFNDWANRFSCVYSDEVFTVEGVAGSTGLRILYSSGRVQERASFVRSSRRFAVSVTTIGQPSDHSAVEALARLADGVAR